MNITAYTYNAAAHCVACTRRRFGRASESMPADANGIPDAPHTPTDREGNKVRPIFSTDENAAGYCDTCGHAYGGAEPVARLLSVDAWREADRTWTWNSWLSRGFVPLAWCDLPRRALLAKLRERGDIPPASRFRVAVEDDGYNVVIVARGTREPLIAIEYGAVQP